MLECDRVKKKERQRKEVKEIEEQKTAVALSYDPKEGAPKIVASGKGYLAEKIIDKATEEKVALHQDEELAGHLSKIQIGDMIPPELYEVVAQVLTFVGDCDTIKRKLSEEQR